MPQFRNLMKCFNIIHNIERVTELYSIITMRKRLNNKMYWKYLRCQNNNNNKK